MGNNRVTRDEVQDHRWEIAEFLDYLRFVAEECPSETISYGDLWTLFDRGVRQGIFWEEAIDELDLISPEWI